MNFLVGHKRRQDSPAFLVENLPADTLLSPARMVLDENNSIVVAAEFGTVDFRELYEDSETVSFSVRSNGRALKFNIEGELNQQSLTVPLLFDEGRFNLLFDDAYTASNTIKKGF